MKLQSFLAALEERIARYDLLCHPYYKAWTAGQLTRDDLREYASDYYHHVAAFPAYLSALHSRLDDGAQRRAVLRNPVSYTHLRAHETVLDLVCRLLLEKKKKK